MTTEFNTPSARSTTNTNVRESFGSQHVDHAEGSGSSFKTSPLDVFSTANLADIRALSSVAEKAAAQLHDCWIAFNDGSASPEKPDAKAIAGTVKSPRELGARIDDVMKGKAPPYDFSSVTPDIKASVVHAIQSGDPHALSEFKSSLDSAIKTKNVGCNITEHGDEITMQMLQRIPGKEQSPSKEGLVDIPRLGLCKELSDREKIEVPKTDPEKLKAASEPITKAITAHKGADELAKAFQDALNQAVPLSELMQSVNKSLPENVRPAGGDAITARKSGDRTSIIVHPGIGGFTLEATEKGGKWGVQDSGEVLRELP